MGKITADAITFIKVFYKEVFCLDFGKLPRILFLVIFDLQTL